MFSKENKNFRRKRKYIFLKENENFRRKPKILERNQNKTLEGNQKHWKETKHFENKTKILRMISDTSGPSYLP